MIFQGICMHSIDVLVPMAVIAGAIPRDITGWRVVVFHFGTSAI